jgi:virginiamycin B lyase
MFRLALLPLGTVALIACLDPRSRLPAPDGGTRSEGTPDGLTLPEPPIDGLAADSTLVPSPSDGGGDQATGTISITEFPLPTDNPGIGAHFIAAGPDGNVWYTSAFRRTIGRVTTDGAITEFPVPLPATDPLNPDGLGASGIVAGRDGNLWFGLYWRNRLGRITPRGEITVLPALSSGTYPYCLTVDPAGNLWYSSRHGFLSNYATDAAEEIGRVTPDGTVTEFPLPNRPGPFNITAGPDGNLWFAANSTRAIGRITPEGKLTEFPTRADPMSITAGPDGNLWFTQYLAPIGRITVDGAITYFTLYTTWGAREITAGPDGNLWFTLEEGHYVGRITTGGAIAEFPLPTRGVVPGSITTGPDGHVWFTDPGRNYITRVIVPR